MFHSQKKIILCVRKHVAGLSVTLLLPHPSKDERNNDNSNQKFKKSLCIFHYDRDLHVHLQNWVKSLKILFFAILTVNTGSFFCLYLLNDTISRLFLQLHYTKRGKIEGRKEIKSCLLTSENAVKVI